MKAHTISTTSLQAESSMTLLPVGIFYHSRYEFKFLQIFTVDHVLSQCSDQFTGKKGDDSNKEIEFITLRVKGQSFMTHQIRKMIGKF